ncbi:MAG TPA: hypothetical protein PK514_12435 [Spirochaetota bacterium]|nr:hypothetical protein [Spirochaetota bacterium]
MINSNKISSEFKEKIRNSVPADFDLTQIGKIDLKEAEQIAREEVIFLREEDLIEGLEEFELIPLKENNIISEEMKVVKPPERKHDVQIIPDKELSAESIDENFLVFDNIQSETDISFKETPDKTEQALIVETEPLMKHPGKPGISVSSAEPVFENKRIPAELPVKIEKINNASENKSGPDTISGISVELEALADFTEHNQQIPDIAEINEVFEDEFLPEKYSEITKKSNVSFIDDRHILREGDFSITADDDQLTSRLSKMIDITKGKSRIIESDADLFNNRYTLEDQKTYEYNDEILYEEKFLTDTDFDYIDNSIVKEDFIQYIQEIDEYYSTEAKYSQSEISEIMGFTRDEDKFVEEILFGDYFKDIDIDSEIEFINPGLDFYSRSISDKKDMIYMLEDPESLKDDEKHSIEADISSGSAIVFEESVKDIETMLGEAPERVVIEKEYIKPRKPVEIKTETRSEPVIFEDITDKVIILDDLDNMNEFMETIPEKKEDLTRLLSYLDGLFEKLPEETVKKFAESEYFDLYVKVLKDMGV